MSNIHDEYFDIVYNNSGVFITISLLELFKHSKGQVKGISLIIIEKIHV